LLTPPDGDEPRFSGVAIELCDDELTFKVPLSYDARWDDEGRRLSDMAKVPSVQFRFIENEPLLPLHARCCSLLEEYFHPRPFPMARLVELGRSCPDQRGYLNWGHDYAEAARVRYNNPWNESDLDRDSGTGLFFEEDPLEIPELAEALHKARLDGPNKKRSTKKRPNKKRIDSKQTHEPVANSFTRLPPEILGYIIHPVRIGTIFLGLPFSSAIRVCLCL
jgi:hypothetical protein